MSVTDLSEPQQAANYLAALAGRDAEPGTARFANVRESIATVSAALARDADVRTLDKWAKGVRSLEWQCCDCGLPGDEEQACCTLKFSDSSEQDFYGATPDEARAKAAAGVREQVKP